MRWVSGNNRFGSPEHRLDVSEPVELDAAYTEFWRRILTDAVEQVANLDWRTIAFQVVPREIPRDKKGELNAFFWDASNRRCKWPDYALSAATFDVPVEGVEEDKHAHDLLLLYLAEFNRLRAVAAVEPVASLFKMVNALRPVKVKGAVHDGWLDLQIGQPEPGPLPDYDRKLLAGQSAQMQPDRGGALDPEWLSLVNAVSAALVRYAPEHFKTIECTVRAQENRLFYEIGCPQYPDEGTTEPGENLHQAMSRLLAYKMKCGATNPAMRFVVQVQNDGSARTHAEILN
jgi:hypothetical protein